MENSNEYELGKLGEDFKKKIYSLRVIIVQVIYSSKDIGKLVVNNDISIDELSNRLEDVNLAIEELASSMEESLA